MGWVLLGVCGALAVGGWFASHAGRRTVLECPALRRERVRIQLQNVNITLDGARSRRINNGLVRVTTHRLFIGQSSPLGGPHLLVAMALLEEVRGDLAEIDPAVNVADKRWGLFQVARADVSFDEKGVRVPLHYRVGAGSQVRAAVIHTRQHKLLMRALVPRG